MNTQLFAKLEAAIEEVILDNCECDYWRGYIYPQLSNDMAKAAALVFDASMEGQKFVRDDV